VLTRSHVHTLTRSHAHTFTRLLHVHTFTRSFVDVCLLLPIHESFLTHELWKTNFSADYEDILLLTRATSASTRHQYLQTPRRSFCQQNWVVNGFAEEGQCFRLQAIFLVMGAATASREVNCAEAQRSVSALCGKGGGGGVVGDACAAARHLLLVGGYLGPATLNDQSVKAFKAVFFIMDVVTLGPNNSGPNWRATVFV
jgi:hypothetical protein